MLGGGGEITMSLSQLKIVSSLEAANLLRERRRRFENFHSKIRNYNDKFFGCYRMSQTSFDELLEILIPSITKQNTTMRMAVSAEERLTITLR